MFLNYVNSDDIFGQINVNRLIYRTSTLFELTIHCDCLCLTARVTGSGTSTVRRRGGMAARVTG